jgi:hypothetical protein
MTAAASHANPSRLVGHILSALVVLFLLFDAVSKILRLPASVEGTVNLGYAATLVPWLGWLLLVCTIVHLIPRTQALGALLLTAYLGGATAALVRIGEPFIFPVIMGMLLWIGLTLRNRRQMGLLTSAQQL